MFLGATLLRVHSGYNNLPLSVSSFIGREREVAEIKDLLASSRLVTLTGAGGCGKTTLALHVARDVVGRYADGVCWVELAPLADSALIPQSILDALGLGEQPNRTLPGTLLDALRDKELLLVLDNCEHLIEATARLVTHLLRQCPDLRLLVTSREALNIDGEQIWVVPSLGFPTGNAPLPASQLRKFDAIQLFVERARAVSPDFKLTDANAATVAQVCKRVDGIPLAIELAAARVNVLGVEQIAARLDDALHFLTHGKRNAPRRHQSLSATLDWSYELLSPEEQRLFRRLSVFAGEFSLDAAEEICGNDEPGRVEILTVLAHLMDKSLVIKQEETSEARYRMLEPIRQYALEQLRQVGEQNSVRMRHQQYFFSLVQKSAPRTFPDEGEKWLGRVRIGYEDVRSALEWAISNGSTGEALRAVCQLWGLWVPGRMLTEGSLWVHRALAAYDKDDELKLQGLRQGILLARLYSDPAQMDIYLNHARALASALEDESTTAWLFKEQGAAARIQGKDEEAIVLLERAVRLYRNLGAEGNLPFSEALYWLADIRLRLGQLAESRLLWEEGLARARAFHDKFYMGWGLGGLATQAQREGKLKQATELERESLAIKYDFRDKAGIAYSLEGLALNAKLEGNLRRAVLLWSAAEQYRESIHEPLLSIERAGASKHMAEARVRLGTSEFDRIWDGGRNLTLEQAIEYANTDRVEPPAAPIPRYDSGALTARERDVLRLLALGMSDAQIAEQLVISRRTVNTHLASIYSKLGVNSRSAATRYALDHKLV